MSISATAVRFDEHTMWVELTDGRTLGVPLAWFPRLLHATPAERERVELAASACIGNSSTRIFPSRPARRPRRRDKARRSGGVRPSGWLKGSSPAALGTDARYMEMITS